MKLVKPEKGTTMETIGKASFQLCKHLGVHCLGGFGTGSLSFLK